MLCAMPPAIPAIRPAGPADLETINGIVSAAVLAWPMAERLKRIAVKVLAYDAMDLRELDVLLAESDGSTAAVAAWDPGTRLAAVGGARGALLHGLYVLPNRQRAGLGSLLQRRVAETAVALGFDGLVVKAERVAVGYFERCGYARLDRGNPFGIDYPYLFWHPLKAGDLPSARRRQETGT